MQNKRYTQNKTKLRKGEYQRSNNTFEYRWTDKHGKRQYIYAKSLPELRKKEAEITRDILDGIDYGKLDLTINDYFEIWKKIKTGIRETTLASYIRVYQRYIETDIGKMKLKFVSYSDVVMFFKNLSTEKGLSFSTIRKVEVCLSMVLDIAVKDDVLRNNPCRGALRELQRECGRKTKDVKALTLNEQKIFEAFLAKPGRYHVYCPIFTVMLWTGMRVGEVVGLRWEDIDFDRNEIDVNHTLISYDMGKGKGSKFTINPPKTKNSIRIVPMLPKVREALLAEKEYQESAGIKCESVVEGYTNFVFLNREGRVFSHKKLNFRLYGICDAINEEIHKNGDSEIDDFPRVHNHVLRHTFATRMREAGADMKATSDVMGHDEIMITLKTYTDTSNDFKKREINRLQVFFDQDSEKLTTKLTTNCG